VKHAEMRGAAAAILFSDPVEVAGDGADEGEEENWKKLA
jgi:hypothetical protein